MTDYFSAADLANVVKEVFQNILQYNKSRFHKKLTIFFFQAALSCLTIDGLETFSTVKKEHFESALRIVKPSLSKEQILW